MSRCGTQAQVINNYYKTERHHNHPVIRNPAAADCPSATHAGPLLLRNVVSCLTVLRFKSIYIKRRGSIVMKLKQLRIRNFSGIHNAVVHFGENGNMTQTVEGDFPVDAAADAGKELVLDAVGWALFGTPGAAAEPNSAVVLEFDNYGVHRKIDSGSGATSLRLFGYETLKFACAATVRELSAKDVAQTQQEINKLIGCSDIGTLRGILSLHSR